MERITRALERAQAQSERRHDAKIAMIAPQVPAAEGPLVDFTETVTARLPVIELDAITRDNERILPAGAAGQHGAAFKLLRTQVLRKLDQLGANTLGVMSAAPGAGKTAVAINLAIAIAGDAARTALLVDFDFRQPSIHQRFHHEPAVGVEECLQQHRPVRDAMFKVAGYERLTVLAARGRVEHSSELLASNRTGEVVNELRSRYANRIVIFDLPPALHADDALAFSQHLQAGLLVIGERRTRRDDIGKTLRLMKDLPFVGTVVNGSREPVASPY